MALLMQHVQTIYGQEYAWRRKDRHDVPMKHMKILETLS